MTKEEYLDSYKHNEAPIILAVKNTIEFMEKLAKNNIIQSDVIGSVCKHNNFVYRDIAMMNQCLDCEKWLD